MAFLVRDAAAPNHPVIGIAALGSSVVQQGLRDRWIGWEPAAFAERLRRTPLTVLGRWCLDSVERHIDGIYLQDLLAEGLVEQGDLASPTAEIVERLRFEAVDARKRHALFPAPVKGMQDARNWRGAALTDLFRAKRCEALARLLQIRIAFQGAGLRTGVHAEVEAASAVDAFRTAVGHLIRITKAEHVGIDMMDITVCGAIAPYNHLLGGKLVCALMCSPEVVLEYRKRYRNQESVIASSMKGGAVRRSPRLVLLGTTSLYGVGSSQYNRIRIPLADVGAEAAGAYQYEELGLTRGYGSFHVSTTTLRLIDTMLARRVEGRRVNSIFGEGVNPLMRKIREALEFLNLPADALLLHGNQRVVYGVPLARNFREILVGLGGRPSYYLPLSRSKKGTEALAAFWRRRWLSPRVRNPIIVDAVSCHSLEYPVAHGARVEQVLPLGDS